MGSSSSLSLSASHEKLLRFFLSHHFRYPLFTYPFLFAFLLAPHRPTNRSTRSKKPANAKHAPAPVTMVTVRSPVPSKKRRSSTSTWIARRNSGTPPPVRLVRKRFKSLPHALPPPASDDIEVDEQFMQDVLYELRDREDRGSVHCSSV